MKSRITYAARALLVVAVAAIAWQSLVPPPQIVMTVSSDKVAHFVAYAVVGALAVLSLPARWWWLAWLATVAMGLLLEIAQAATPYRSFEWGDLAADAVGALVGVTIGVVAARAFAPTNTQ